MIESETTRDETAAGSALAEALAALLLLGLSAVAAVGLTHRSVHALRQVSRVDKARIAAAEIARELTAAPWHALPHRFGAAPADVSRLLDSADGTVPSNWAELVEELPEGRIEVELRSLAPEGASAPVRDAVAFRLTTRVSYRSAPGARRTVGLQVLRP